MSNSSSWLLRASKLTLALLVMAAANMLHANSLEDKHRFVLGISDKEIDVSGHASRKPLPAVDFDFDQVLGLEDSSDTFFLSYRWRFSERWSVYALYSNLEADGQKTTSRDFVWDGNEISVGAMLDTEFGLDTYLLEVNFAFIRDERKEFGIGFGLHAFEIETVIEIDAATDDQQRNIVRTDAELLAPLPNVLGYGIFAITPRWEVSGSVGWLSLDYEDFSGEYLFALLSTEYRFTKSFGIGARYQVAEIDVSRKSSGKSRAFDIDIYGPSIYLSLGF